MQMKDVSHQEVTSFTCQKCWEWAKVWRAANVNTAVWKLGVPKHILASWHLDTVIRTVVMLSSDLYILLTQ